MWQRLINERHYNHSCHLLCVFPFQLLESTCNPILNKPKPKPKEEPPKDNGKDKDKGSNEAEGKAAAAAADGAEAGPQGGQGEGCTQAADNQESTQPANADMELD